MSKASNLLVINTIVIKCHEITYYGYYQSNSKASTGSTVIVIKLFLKEMLKNDLICVIDNKDKSRDNSLGINSKFETQQKDYLIQPSDRHGDKNTFFCIPYARTNTCKFSISSLREFGSGMACMKKPEKTQLYPNLKF